MPLRTIYDASAPAKLNLFLHVVGRRGDGYHLLQSAFVLIDWCDTLHFERRIDGRLTRHDLTQALPADDLCLRAARSLQQRSGTSWGADISIAKEVPWGAGMGGGSSDAATTLLALNRLWQLGWPLSRLAALGLELGADVPFFIGGRNAWVEGIGERLTPLTMPSTRFAVVKPPAAIATKAIFESPLMVRDTPPAILAGFSEEHGPASLGEHLLQGYGSNDLQAAAEHECPEVTQALALLSARFGHSRMTGSGSAVFSTVKTTGTNDGSAATLPEFPAKWIGRMCQSLEHHPLCGWAEAVVD